MARGPLRISRAGRPPIETRPDPDTLAFALLSLPGGKRRFMACVRLAAQRDARLARLVALWDSLSRYKQDRVLLEDLCAAVDVAPGELLSQVTHASLDFSLAAATLQFAVAYPSVVGAMVRRACRPAGWKKRHLLLERMGFLPTRQPVTLRPPDAGPSSAVEREVPAFLKALDAVVKPRP